VFAKPLLLWKAINNTYNEYAPVVLVIQHSKPTRRVILSSVISPALPYFFHIISQTARFSGKVIEHKMCVVVFSTTFVGNISHSKKN
jgi:hypothetical protein